MNAQKTVPTPKRCPNLLTNLAFGRGRVGALLLMAALTAAPASAHAAMLADGPVTMTAAKAPAGDLNAPLPTDERLVQGVLPNGMKYIVMKHQNPPGRANLWIHISSGSMNESEEQRGLAHYLEHMAFNGSENFPPGSVISFFESMGLTFGQHQNAFTSFDQTTYQLSFPDTKPETIDKGMTFFADVAGRLLLSPKEIDEEREVIKEEKRARSGGQQRIQDYILERIAPGSLVGRRLPIGTDETLSAVNEKNFRDYYGKWYVPSNMTVMVVADAEPATMVEHIKKNFNFGENTPAPQDQDAGVTPTDKTFAIVATDKEITQASISISRIGKPRSPVTTYQRMREDLVTDLGTTIFNRRLGAKINKGGTAYLTAGASSSNAFRSLRWTDVQADGRPEDWKTILNELGTDLQQARLHGFTQRELDDVKKELIADAERFVEQEKTLPAQIMMRRMNSTLADGDAIMSATQQLDALKRVLPGISLEEVSSNFASEYDPTNVAVVATLPTSVSDIPSESELVTLGRKALDVTPGKMQEESRPTELLAKVPTPGAIAEQAEHAASNVATATFANGVSVRYRFMDIRKDQVQVSINLAGGTIQETAKDRGIAEVAGLAWGRPATSTLTSTNIRDLMTGKKVNVGGFAGTDTLSMSISGSPADLESGFQLAYLLLTDPKIEEGAFEQWKKATLQEIDERATNPQAAFFELLTTNTYPASEARMQMISADQVNALKLADAQAWLSKTLASAPIEVSIVGDIQKDEAMRLVATYVGSLSNRAKISDKTLDEIRSVKRPAGPITVSKTMKTQTPMALACIGFFGPDFENIVETRTMQAAGRVMSTRMTQRVREKEQLAYSPQAGMRPEPEYPGFSKFMAVMPTDPGKIERLLTVMNEMLSDFVKYGPTEDEMVTLKKQMANTLDEQMKQPGFWVGNIGTMAYRGRTLDDVMAAHDFYQNLTAEQIKTVFAKYCKPENMMTLTLVPEGSASAGEGEKPMTPPTREPATGGKVGG